MGFNSPIVVWVFPFKHRVISAFVSSVAFKVDLNCGLSAVTADRRVGAAECEGETIISNILLDEVGERSNGDGAVTRRDNVQNGACSGRSTRINCSNNGIELQKCRSRNSIQRCQVDTSVIIATHCLVVPHVDKWRGVLLGHWRLRRASSDRENGKNNIAEAVFAARQLFTLRGGLVTAELERQRHASRTAVSSSSVRISVGENHHTLTKEGSGVVCQ